MFKNPYVQTDMDHLQLIIFDLKNKIGKEDKEKVKTEKGKTEK